MKKLNEALYDAKVRLKRAEAKLSAISLLARDADHFIEKEQCPGFAGDIPFFIGVMAESILLEVTSALEDINTLDC